MNGKCSNILQSEGSRNTFHLLRILVGRILNCLRLGFATWSNAMGLGKLSVRLRLLLKPLYSSFKDQLGRLFLSVKFRLGVNWPKALRNEPLKSVGYFTISCNA